jgi:hypothetical protein
MGLYSRVSNQVMILYAVKDAAKKGRKEMSQQNDSYQLTSKTGACLFQCKGFINLHHNQDIPEQKVVSA